MRFPVVLLAVSTLMNTTSGAEYFVSPNGDDAHVGTKNAPFRTIAKARDAARASKGDEAVTVYLRGGTYVVSETIEFDSRDSGTAEHPVIYKAYADEEPIVSGGVHLDGWEKDGNVMWKASTNGMEFRQLYVDNAKATRSRWPNEGKFFSMVCLLYTSPSPRDGATSRMPSSA